VIQSRSGGYWPKARLKTSPAKADSPFSLLSSSSQPSPPPPPVEVSGKTVDCDLDEDALRENASVVQLRVWRIVGRAIRSTPPLFPSPFSLPPHGDRGHRDWTFARAALEHELSLESPVTYRIILNRPPRPTGPHNWFASGLVYHLVDNRRGE